MHVTGKDSLDGPGCPHLPLRLADRDIDMLPLIASGLSDKQIASVLGLSPATVSTYVRDLLVKCGAVNRAHLVAMTFMAGVLLPGDGRAPVWSGVRHLPWP